MGRGRDVDCAATAWPVDGRDDVHLSAGAVTDYFASPKVWPDRQNQGRSCTW